jgi:hypothetical protein
MKWQGLLFKGNSARAEGDHCIFFLSRKTSKNITSSTEKSFDFGYLNSMYMQLASHLAIRLLFVALLIWPLANVINKVEISRY